MEAVDHAQIGLGKQLAQPVVELPRLERFITDCEIHLMGIDVIEQPGRVEIVKPEVNAGATSRIRASSAGISEGKNLKGWLLGLVLGTIGRSVLETAFESSSKRSRRGLPSPPPRAVCGLTWGEGPALGAARSRALVNIAPRSMFLLYRELHRIIVRAKRKMHRVCPEMTE